MEVLQTEYLYATEVSLGFLTRALQMDSLGVQGQRNLCQHMVEVCLTFANTNNCYEYPRLQRIFDEMCVLPVHLTPERALLAAFDRWCDLVARTAMDSY